MKSRQSFLILVLILVFSVFVTSCTAASTSATTDATTSAGTTKASETTASSTAAPKAVKMKLMKMYDWASAPENWSWGDDPVTKKMTEMTGVTLEILTPAGNGDEKALAMLASGDYPDIMWMDRNPVLQKYIDEGALYAIDDLAKQYNCPKLVGEYVPENVVKYLARPDGHLYVIPNWHSEKGELGVGDCFMVRQDCYQAVGSPEITTLEDFTNYLRKVKEANLKFGNTNVMPIALETSVWRTLTLGNLWGEKINSNSYYDEASKTVKFAMRAKGAYEAAKWWNMLYREGLADSEVFTLEAQQITENFNSGKYAASVDQFWNRTANDAILQKTDANAFYKAIPLPVAVKGVTPRFAAYSVVGWNVNVITKNCKDPEAAVKFYDYLCSPEGQRLSFSGIEGLTMKEVAPDGRGVLMDGIYDQLSTDWAGTTKKYGLRLLDLVMYQKYNWEYINETGIRHENRMLVESYNWDGTGLGILQFDASTDVGIKWSNIQGQVNTAGFAAILTADSESAFESAYAKTLADYENMGLADVEAGWTQMYKEIMSIK